MAYNSTYSLLHSAIVHHIIALNLNITLPGSSRPLLQNHNSFFFGFFKDTAFISLHFGEHCSLEFFLNFFFLSLLSFFSGKEFIATRTFANFFFFFCKTIVVKLSHDIAKK